MTLTVRPATFWVDTGDFIHFGFEVKTNESRMRCTLTSNLRLTESGRAARNLVMYG